MTPIANTAMSILVPGKPAELNFWNVTFSSLELEWAPPAMPNGQIIKYELAYQDENPGGKCYIMF